MRKSLSVALAALITVALAASCASGARGDRGLQGKAIDKPVPIQLSEAEQERMELDAIYSLVESRDFIPAESRLTALVLAKPDNRSFPVLHSSVLMSMGRLEDARAVLKNELATYQDNKEALFVLAELERFAGDAKAQRASLEALLRVDPQNADAQAAMGDIHYDGKNYTKAEESYTRALAQAPDHVEALLGLARVKYRRDDMKGALGILDKAIEIAPGDALAYLDRSRVLYQMGRYDDCEADLDQAISLAPESAWNYLERGRLYLDSGRPKLAMADFTNSIRLQPDYFLSYVYRAAIFEADGDDSSALADYRKASSLYPDYWYSFESMGVLAYRLGSWSEAFSSFDKAATYTKNHAEYYIAAALSLMRSGNSAAAREYAGKTLARVDKDTYPAQWLALRLLMDQGDMSSELEVRIGAEKNLDVRAGMLFYLGAYWVARGKVELGQKYIRMSYDAERIGTIERRMAEADLARLSNDT
ncbi:MAG: tetratricopeptide repeat protein [Spirochaetia bacterium]|jgi:tetratricopeptide (TPR) repeat protein|nr:tetratricopeptide repeat protein [Spirochaetia bacterium]